MQRHQFASSGLKIEQLVNVGHVGAGHRAGAPLIRVIWSDAPFWQMLEHGFRQQSLTNDNDTDRSAVIVNRSTLARTPAQQK